MENVCCLCLNLNFVLWNQTLYYISRIVCVCNKNVLICCRHRIIVPQLFPTKFVCKKSYKCCKFSHPPIVDTFLKLFTTLIHLLQFLEDLFVLFSIGKIPPHRDAVRNNAMEKFPRCSDMKCSPELANLGWFVWKCCHGGSFLDVF